MYVSSDKLAFVVVAGCQRSGTTLLGQILGAHPSAVLIDEPVAYRVIDKLIEDDLDDTLLAECIEAAASIYRASRDACRPELTHVVLKAPNATFRGSELAKINRFAMSYVFAVRDIRDVVSSMSRLFNIDMVSRQAVWLGRAPDEVKSPLINELVCMNDAGVSVNVRRAAVWLAKTSQYRAFTSPPLSGCLVKYEELVRTPDVVKRALCEHVGLDVEQLPEHSEVMCGSGPGYTVRSRSIDGESIGRWTDSVVADMQDEIWNIGASLMSELGYVREMADDLAGLRLSRPRALSQPVVFLGRGGSGTRLLSMVAQELGVFLGNQLNASGDSEEWVDVVYELATCRLLAESVNPRHSNARINKRARSILQKRHGIEEGLWGWKLPETMLILPEVLDAFPEARFVHLVRNPLDVCLRRTHVTSRWSNPVGRALLDRAAVDLGLELREGVTPDHIANAASWEFQLSTVLPQLRSLDPARNLEVRYEDLLDRPQETVDRIAGFLGVDVVITSLESSINPRRRRSWQTGDGRIDDVRAICKSADSLGYSI